MKGERFFRKNIMNRFIALLAASFVLGGCSTLQGSGKPYEWANVQGFTFSAKESAADAGNILVAKEHALKHRTTLGLDLYSSQARKGHAGKRFYKFYGIKGDECAMFFPSTVRMKAGDPDFSRVEYDHDYNKRPGANSYRNSDIPPMIEHASNNCLPEIYEVHSSR